MKSPIKSTITNLAANTLPRTLDLLFPLVERILQGLIALEAGLPPEHRYAARLLSLLDAAKKAQAAYQAGRSKWDGTLRPASRDSKDALRSFIVKARTRLKLRLGETWNSTWSEAGFVSASLAMPRREAERSSLVASLKRFFAAHPEHEDRELGITAQEAEGAHGAYILTTQEHDAQRTSQKTLAAKRDAAVEALRIQTRGVIYLLRGVLDGNDPRWSTLGLNAPKAATSSKRRRAETSEVLQVVAPAGERSPAGDSSLKAA